ncbi:hypothetical protein [Paraglaciecola sp.]|uniref:hypothetical protein n=1 Tax=Paraglaciecola sp. TaxID=1920173 RepID=UPI0030F3FB66
MRKRVSFIFLSIILLNHVSASAKGDYSHALFDLFETLKPVGFDIGKKFASIAKETNIPVEFKSQFQTCIDQEIIFLFKEWEPNFSKHLSLNDLQDLTAKLTLPAGTNYLKFKAGKLDKSKLSAAQVSFNEAMDKSGQFKNFEQALKQPTVLSKNSGIAFAKYCHNKATSTTNQPLLNSGITIPVPAYWQIQTLDLGTPFGKSDVLVDESMNKIITFMSFPDDIKDNKTFTTIYTMV